MIFFVSITIVSLLLLVPLILTPFTTSTPKAIWIPLAIIDVLFIIFALRIRQKKKTTAVMLSGFMVVSATSIIASQIFASTPHITDTNGRPILGSIASLEKINLNGSEQWITIRGKDITKPVLLYLGIGGPGAGGFPATFTSLKPLEDHFVVVNWDQPGTGKSYDAVRINTLTTQRFIEDAKTLTEMMRTRFNQNKIYVMGLSWGTIVGIKLVQQYPDLFHAYIGTGQMVNTVENDKFGYNLALKITLDKGSLSSYTKLKNNGEPPYTGTNMALKYADYNNILFDHMDSPNIWMVMLLVPQLAKEYGFIDKLNFDRGLIESYQVLYPQLKDLDFTTQATKLDVPVYFLVGRKDVNAVASMVERYYNILDAPKKELIWLESGHGASAEEIQDAMLKHVLPQTGK